MGGSLFIVATPIGNLADMTYRAVETLNRVDLIACEDTRQTRKLLDHYGVTTAVVSYHEHNEEARTEDLLRRLASGASVALVSDAGTPLVADPGYRVVEAAVRHGHPVIAIPGACAAIAALAVSGLPTDSFCFAGFLPRKSHARRELLAAHLGRGMTLVVYESPHRIMESLEDFEAVLGTAPLVVARELTKVHEEILRGPAGEVRAQLAARDAIRGEFTVVVGPLAAPAKPPEDLAQTVAELERGGYTRMDAIKEAARRHGMNKREAYRRLEVG